MKFRYEKTVRAGSEFKTRETARESELDADIEHNEMLPEDGGQAKAKKRGRKTYRTEWREPKLVTIFIIDRILAMAKNSSSVMIHKVLDCCHAIGQMQAALKQFCLSETMLKGLSRLHRKQNAMEIGNWLCVL